MESILSEIPAFCILYKASYIVDGFIHTSNSEVLGKARNSFKDGQK